MTTPSNRATRRLQARKDKNRKNGLAALSLLAATGLMSSYVSVIRNTASFSAPTCEHEFEVNRTAPELGQYDDLDLLSFDLNDLDAGPEECVLITFVNGTDVFSGEQLTFISGSKFMPSEIFVYGNGATIDGFNGVQILYSDIPLTINELNFEEGAAETGGAIYTYGVPLTVIDSTFSYNNAVVDGGAIYVTGEGSELTVSGSTFLNNSAGDIGGAIRSDGSVTINLESDFRFNSSGEGGAVTAWDGLLSISDSNFTENSALTYWGGAVSAYDVTVTGSTFTGNTASSEGGAIHSFHSLDVSGGSVFENNEAAIGGALALYGYQDEELSGYLNVSDSIFENNSAEILGGAIFSASGFYSKFGEFDSTVRNSVFLLNVAGYIGGAIFDESSPLVLNSTFAGNHSLDSGGAISAQYPEVFNSTFYYNSSGEGGAIDFNQDASIGFNTFLDNEAVNVNEGESISSYEGGSIFGNIFASSEGDESRQVWVEDWFSPGIYEYNLSTGVEDDGSWGETNQTVLFSALDLDTDLSDAPETISILSSRSVAVDFVPRDSELANPVTSEGTPYDQRGVERLGALDAGAFEFGLAAAATVTPFIPPFIVLDAKPVNTSAGKIVQATGVNLTRVTDVYVNGIRVEITSRAGSSISFIAPTGLTGLADVRFVGDGHEITLEDALNFAAAAIAGDKAKTVIPGFRANSTKLTRPMKKAIRAFLKANPELTAVTCKGFTSAPATAADLRLARQRGKATCDYIQKLNPELTVRVLKGSHNNTPGQKIRRVRIVMQ